MNSLLKHNKRVGIEYHRYACGVDEPVVEYHVATRHDVNLMNKYARYRVDEIAKLIGIETATASDEYYEILDKYFKLAKVEWKLHYEIYRPKEVTLVRVDDVDDYITEHLKDGDGSVVDFHALNNMVGGLSENYPELMPGVMTHNNTDCGVGQIILLDKYGFYYAVIH